MTRHRLGTILFGAFAGGWIGRALWRWILDVGGSTETWLIVGTAVLGALAGLLATLGR